MAYCQHCGAELTTPEKCEVCGEYVVTPQPQPTQGGVLQKAGIHPLVALTVSAVDTMLFGATVTTAGVGWLASIPVGAALAIGTTLVQHKSYGDDWITSAGKGVMIGVLTAIPTPLPSLLTMSSGALGFFAMRKK